VVIAYASRALSKPERNYDTTRRELLAIVHGLKTYKQYLLGRHFVIRTDHSALQWLRKTPEPLAQLARWLVFIEQFDFDVLHRPGSRHGNVDRLSRKPVEAVEADGIVRGGCGDAASDEPDESPGVLDDSAGEHPIYIYIYIYIYIVCRVSHLQLYSCSIQRLFRSLDCGFSKLGSRTSSSHSVRLRRCSTDTGSNLSLWTACCIDVGAARKVSLLCFSYWYLLHFVMISSAVLIRVCVVDI